MTGYEDNPALTREDVVEQARHYMSLYMTAYSGLLRLASPDMPEEAMRKTAVYVKDDIEEQMRMFEERHPGLRG